MMSSVAGADMQGGLCRLAYLCRKSQIPFHTNLTLHICASRFLFFALCADSSAEALPKITNTLLHKSNAAYLLVERFRV